MLKFNASDFYKVTAAIQHTQTTIEALGLRSKTENPDKSVTITPINDPVFIRTLSERCDKLVESLKVLGARLTLMAVQDMRWMIATETITFEALADAYKDINRTLKRELTLVTLLSLDTKEQAWFEPREPLFGPDFANKFRTKGAFELDEATKCIALGRPTATVFHLMRVLEVGIHALAACLDIPDPIRPAERNWGIILRKIMREGIEKKWPDAKDRMCVDALLMESLHASSDSIKNPWRNETMHVEGKYTDDEAEHIFVSVRGFMTKLASRMDEDGNPKV